MTARLRRAIRNQDGYNVDFSLYYVSGMLMSLLTVFVSVIPAVALSSNEANGDTGAGWALLITFGAIALLTPFYAVLAIYKWHRIKLWLMRRRLQHIRKLYAHNYDNYKLVAMIDDAITKTHTKLQVDMIDDRINLERGVRMMLAEIERQDYQIERNSNQYIDRRYFDQIVSEYNEEAKRLGEARRVIDSEIPSPLAT